MGQMYQTYYKSPDTSPNYNAESTFDPLYGFPNGRKERVMHATEQEMEDAGLTVLERDYCSHHLIDFMKCRKQKFPYIAACKHEKHIWESCEYDDWVLRMKEFEREKRLLERAKRKGILRSGETMKE